MKKKILSLALVVAMLASMLVFAPVSGATEAQATVRTTDAAGSAGDTVSVDVMLTTAEVKTLTLIFEYDASRLEFLGYDAGANFPGINSNYDTNAAYLQWTENGPYKTLGFASLSGIVDCTEETLFATLNFRIKTDAPLGDAFVAFRHLEGTVKNPTTGNDDLYYAAKIVPSVTENVIQEAGAIEYVASAVTVLPEGYINMNVNTLGDFTYSGRSAATLNSYTGNETGTLVIPSTAFKTDGTTVIPVTTVGAEIFGGKSFSTLVVPASVTTLGDAFIYEHKVDLTVYVLNADTTFGSEAIVDCVGSVTICAPDDSYAHDFADQYGYNFVALETCSLTVNGASYLVPVNTEIAAPGVATTDDGKVVVGWNDGTKTYAPGAAMTLTGDTTLTPVTIDAIEMNTGVGFKMGATIDKCQMRFTTDMTVADYNTLASLGTVTLGTIITPAKYVSMAGGLTKEALTQLAKDKESVIGPLVSEDGTGAGLTYIDVPASAANPYKETTDTYTFAGSLAGFKNENVNTKNVVYAAAFYATVELADGSSFTIYSNFDFGANRSVGDAITAMTNVEGGLTNTEANTLRDWIAAN